MKDRVTMTMVAKRAGVHATTVSLALRNHPSLPVATRQRLQTLAEKMGYKPDPALSALVAYRSQKQPPKNYQTLAYVTNWHSRWGWKGSIAHSQFFAGASAKAERLGYRLEHFWLSEEGLCEKRLSEMLYSRGISGIILSSHLARSGDALNFDWGQFSAVKIDFYPHHPALHSVTNDQRAIMQLIVQRVRAAGYRRIGFVMPEWWDLTMDLAWSAGFLAELHRIAPADHVPILHFPEAVAETNLPLATLEPWYRKYKPEVIVSSRVYIQNRLENLGLSVPQDVAFADIFLEECDGGTAGVHHNCLRVGELAVEVLVGQLQQNTRGIPEFQTATLVKGTWFDGASLPCRKTAAMRQTTK